MGVLLYAFGCFSVKPDPARPLIRRNNQQAPTAEDTPSARKRPSGKAVVSTKLPSGPKAKKTKSGMRRNLEDHQSDIFSAYVLASPSYIIDELFIDFQGREDDAQNNPVHSREEDRINKKSQFYKEGCLQFGRDIFRDFDANDPNKDYEGLEDERNWISDGIYACYQLEHCFYNLFRGRKSLSLYSSVYGPYLEMLPRSTGWVSYTSCTGHDSLMLGRHPDEWMSAKYAAIASSDPRGSSVATIEQIMAAEIAGASPDEDLVDDLRLLQIRRSHGWVEEDD